MIRQKIGINDGWVFAKTAAVPECMPADWEQVSLPHTWNAVDGQDGGNDYYRGTCMYARKLNVPAPEDGGRVFVEFPGAAMSAKVFINGTSVVKHAGGYSCFRADITDLLTGDDLLCVQVDNADNNSVYPQKADFTFYGGLYRGASLIVVPERHFELVKDGSTGIKVTPVVDLAGGTAVVTVETWQNADKVTVCVDGQSQTVASDGGYAKAEFKICGAHLWDGVDDPYLYTASASLESGDEVTTRFGIREMKATKDGFFLNGRAYPLRGVSRHQDRKGLGNALTMAEHAEDMELIKEVGANSVRLAHYQHAQEFYDLCDENGIVAWAEIPYISEMLSNGAENTISQMRELITQNYNHPCIAVWGLSNEITVNSPDTQKLMAEHNALNDLCHSMDPTRQTTMAHVFMLETDSPLIDIPDVGAYNLYFGWYLGELEQNEEFFDKFRREYPERAIGFSEYGADTNPAFHSTTPEAGDYTEEYQCVYHEHILKLIDERPWLWCTYVWNMFDFAADGRDEGGKRGENQKGLVTMDRKIKKDAFYAYKAAWSKDPFVYVCGHRYVNRAEDVTKVKVYSNQSEVTLYVDGQEAGSQTGSRVFEFEVPITGEHVIEARSGECTDSITVKKVAEPDPSYVFIKREVVNWFDKDTFKPENYSIQDKLGVLMADPRTSPIVGRLMAQASASRGDVAQSASGNENLARMMGQMSLAGLLKKAGDAVSPEAIEALNTALQKIPKEQ